jgi:hypothetical protein
MLIEFYYYYYYYYCYSWDGIVVGTATRCGLDGLVTPVGGETFLTRPERSWCLPSLLYNGHLIRA